MSKNHREKAHGREWEIRRRECFERDRYRCQVPDCGRGGDLECHHVRALEHGGTNDLANLLTVCRTCHIAVHLQADQPIIEEWKRFRDELT